MAKTQQAVPHLRKLTSKLLDPETYSKATVFKVLLILLALLFWTPLVAFYQRILVEPVLSQLTPHWTRDLLAGLTVPLLGLLLAAHVRVGYRLGWLQLVVLLLPGLLYLVVRLHGGNLWGQHWHYTPFSTLPDLHYADIVFLPLLGVPLLLLALRQRRRAGPAAASYLHADGPTATPDTLRRGPSASGQAEAYELDRPPPL